MAWPSDSRATMYDLYKPLRNYLRRHEALSGLKAVYQYMQFLQFDIELPHELRHPELRWRTPRSLGLLEWELQTLAREILLNCSVGTGQSLYSWSAIASAINKIKNIENETWGRFAKDGDILFELARIANRQFHWQLGFTKPIVSRHFRIANHPLVRPNVLDEFGMSPKELFQLGLSLAGLFLKHSSVALPLRNLVNQVPPETCMAFLTRFSRSLPEHVALVKRTQSYDINWAYSFSSLEEFPLIKVSDTEMICPIPPLLLRRICEGLYFDLVRRGDEFSKTFGAAYEDYVGDVLHAANSKEAFRILKAEKYGAPATRKDTVDWIAEDGKACLFIECKAGRVRLQAKVDLLARDSIEKELKRLAEFIAQTYTTLDHALNGQYESWKPSSDAVYPVIVTLDNWQRFGLIVNNAISRVVEAELDKKGLDKALLTKYPYTVCSIDEFEQAIQIMSHVGINTLMSKKTTGEHAQWEMLSVINNFFDDIAKEYVRPLFNWDFVSANFDSRFTA